jgi:hypothetical protein
MRACLDEEESLEMMAREPWPSRMVWVWEGDLETQLWMGKT